LCAQGPISFATWSCSFAIEGSGFIKSGNKLWEYKPLHDQWIQRTNFPGLCTNGSAGFSIEQRGYITCGYIGGLSNVTDQVWSFHPASNTWKQEIEFEGTKRRFPVAFAIHNRGYFGTGTNGINFNDFWQFNPTDNTIGLDANEVQFNIFPNPVITELHIKSSILGSSSIRISIYNSLGKLVFSDTAADYQKIQFTDWNAGIYLLRIENEGKLVLEQKIVKQ
jgi:hypothetical protein